MSTQRSNTIVVESPSTSGVAIAGLIFSVLGWFTCGVLCIPGALLSFLGLFDRGPKGAALAGLIVGFPGVLFFALFGFSMIAALLGIGSAVDQAAKRPSAPIIEAPVVRDSESEPVPATETDSVSTADSESMSESKPQRELTNAEKLLNERRSQQEQAAREAAERLVKQRQAEEAEKARKKAEEDAKFRTWTSASGKYTQEAKIISYANGTITIESRQGKRVKVPLEKLSQADKDFVEKWRKAR